MLFLTFQPISANHFVVKHHVAFPAQSHTIANLISKINVIGGMANVVSMKVIR